MNGEGPNNKSGLSGVAGEVRQYVEKRMELFALTLSEQVSLMLADSIQKTIGILLLAGGLFFAWFAAGFYMSEVFESFSLGFLSVSVPLLLGGLVFLKIKPKSLTRNIQGSIVKGFLKSIDENKQLLHKNEQTEESTAEEQAKRAETNRGESTG